METKLYSGIAFSPPAALADNVGAGDTVIPVSDISAFPAAPNLATIGADEEAETISYAAKTATALSGCVRGVEGTARAWSAGEPIARNWTAKDHADLIAAVGESDGAAQAAQEAADSAATAAQAAQTTAQSRATMEQVNTAIAAAVSAKQDKLTGQPGQVVGFGVDGLAVASQGWSNPNLLDNWYFVNPVNQRGKAEYTSPGGVLYTIDRWYLSKGGDAMTVEEGSIRIKSGGHFWQRREAFTLGAAYTFSALTSGGDLVSVTEKNFSAQTHTSITSGTANLHLQYYEDTLATGIYAVGGDVEAIAAKLELGPVQTLAHQDAAGNWVLNDPLPNKAMELLKCQRYQYKNTDGATEFVRAARITPNAIFFDLPVPTRMRKAPSIVNSDSLSVYSVVQNSGSDTAVSGFTFAATLLGGTTLRIQASKTAHGLSDAALFATSTLFDANL